MNRITSLLAALAITLGVAGLIGCSSGQPDTYAPPAYGVAGQCYYAESPAEVVALQQAGLCPRSWVPALMPLGWHEEYWPYYDSPAYYSRYVPASARSSYATRERTFGRTYHTAIAARSRTATYRSSSGKLVKGSAVVTGKSRFGSGTTGTQLGGGSRGKTGSGSSGTSGYGSGSRNKTGSSGGYRSGSGKSGSGFGGGSRSGGGRH